MLTGTSPNRADYQEMLANAQAGKFSHLGLYRADRFGRNAVEGLQAATKLISWGVKVRLRNAELSLAELERDAKVHLDDLDLAIGLLNELVDYYFWLEEKQKEYFASNPVQADSC